MAGANVRLSPEAYIAFTRAGRNGEPFVFTATLEDVAGATLPVPAGGLSWALVPGHAFRIGAAGVAEDQWAATARLDPVAGGRDSVIVRHGSASDTAYAENWEWIPADWEWNGGRWTSAGESLCVQVALQARSLAAGLSDFDLFVASFDQAMLRVDSARVNPGGRSLRLCMTAQASGRTAVALVGRNTTRHQFWGWHREHTVLESPLTLSYEHGDAYEIGIGQRTELKAVVSDRRGTAVLLDETEAVSWTSDDASVATVDATGSILGRSSGTVSLSMAYRDLKNAQAVVDVFEITGGLVGEEIVCVSTRRGTVRCWGSSDEEGMMGYGVTHHNLGTVRPWEVGDVPVGARVRNLLQASVRAACAITVLSDLRCWGDPNWGSLGYGNNLPIGDDEYPRAAGPVPLGGTPAYVGGGEADHFCVVLTSGGVRCVGSNLAGQVGYGIPHSRESVIGDNETPAEMGDVPLGGPAVHVATGGRAGMTCAALANGRGRCWGINAGDWEPSTQRFEPPVHGLGYGRSQGYDSPIGDDETPADAGDLPLDGRILMFALGGHHICALMEGGGVRCWGDNYWGQRGAGLDESDDLAHAGESVELVFPTPAVQLVAGWNHVCVLMESGAVRCWGQNIRGVLGYGDDYGRGNLESAEFIEDVPLGGPAAMLLGPGQYENCAVMRAGGLRCWGANWDGHFGYPFSGDVGDDETPASVGDIMVFPGPVPSRRLGVEASRSSSRAGWYRPAVGFGLAHAATPSTLVLTTTSADPPWRGPLDGTDGVVLPDAVPASAVWVAVAGAYR